MQISVTSGAPEALRAGALVVPVFADGRLDGAAQAADTALAGAIADVLASNEFKGATGELVLLHAASEPKRVLLVGLGDRTKFDASSLAKYAGAAVRYLGKRGITKIAFALPLEAAKHASEAAGFIVEGALGGTIDSTTYRTEPEKPIVLETVTLVTTAGATELDRAKIEAGAERGRIIGEAVNYARILALTPANDMTPTILASRAAEVAEKYGLKFHSLDEEAMLAKGMGSILGVSRGSDEDAAMIVLEYTGDPSSKDKLALVGKGLTFDSGGISIKPAENMHEMKYDMCGGAGVIAAMGAIAQLKPKANIIGIVPSSENLPGPRAMKPGDEREDDRSHQHRCRRASDSRRRPVLRTRARRDEDRRCRHADRRDGRGARPFRDGYDLERRRVPRPLHRRHEEYDGALLAAAAVR
jgi:leucyl aminopeptidase